MLAPCGAENLNPGGSDWHSSDPRIIGVAPKGATHKS